MLFKIGANLLKIKQENNVICYIVAVVKISAPQWLVCRPFCAFRW